MKKKVTVTTSPGDVLQVHSSRGPIGQSFTVAAGVTSVNVLFRDSKSVEAAKLRRKEKRRAGKRARPTGTRAAKKDDDED